MIDYFNNQFLEEILKILMELDFIQVKRIFSDLFVPLFQNIFQNKKKGENKVIVNNFIC
jgi:hypothetical protein